MTEENPQRVTFTAFRSQPGKDGDRQAMVDVRVAQQNIGSLVRHQGRWKASLKLATALPADPFPIRGFETLDQARTAVRAVFGQ